LAIVLRRVMGRYALQCVVGLVGLRSTGVVDSFHASGLVFETECGAIIWAEVGYEKFTAVDVEELD